MTASRRRFSRAACVLLAALGAAHTGCGGSDNNAATAPTVTTGPQTALFEGTIPVGGSAFYSFTVSDTGDANVMLASVTTSTSPGTSTSALLGLGIGTPLGTDCTETKSILAFPALQSPLVANLTPGIYCVRIYDVGNLQSGVNFAIRIVHT